MNDWSERTPLLNRYFREYLDHADVAAFVAATSSRYTMATLERLAEGGEYSTRRAATLALGLLGDFRTTPVLARRLHDSDRAVRVLADHGIRDLWCRFGSAAHQHQLRTVIRLNQGAQWHDALELVDKLLEQLPEFAEAWSQRGQAQFRLRQFDNAMTDCRMALHYNPYDFISMVQMGQCYLQSQDPAAALQCLQDALAINPNLERVRLQISQVRRAIQRDS